MIRLMPIDGVRITALRAFVLNTCFLMGQVGFCVACLAETPPAGMSAAASTTTALRAATQALLDAIAPGDVATWDRLLDPAVIQVDENDVIRHKAEILAALKPLGPGLVGHLKIDDFQVSEVDDVAVVTHEDEEYLNYHGQILMSRFRMTDTWHRTADGWRLLGSQVLAVLKDPPSIALPMKTLCGYSGRYSMTPEITVSIRCGKDRLLVERPGHPARTFFPEVKDVFFEPGEPRTRRIFLRDSTGAITGFVDRREARDVAWRRIG